MNASAATRSDLITRVAPSILLAPSAHNTQPWKLRVEDGVIDILIDPARHLRISDPTRRQLFVSIGCAIENARIAGEHEGYAVAINLLPEGNANLAARITFASHSATAPDSSLAKLFAAIPQRRTDRSFYDAKPLTEAEYDVLPTTRAAGVIRVTNKQQIMAIADLTKRGTAHAMSRPDFKQELSHWVRNSWTRQPDGMPGYAMDPAMPAPVSLLMPAMVRVAPIHKKEAPKRAQQIMSSSEVIVIATPSNTAGDQLEAGQLLERLWLELTAAGLAAAPLAAAIEASQDTLSELKRTLNTEQHPQVILRIGHSSHKNPRPTPRRSLEECLA